MGMMRIKEALRWLFEKMTDPIVYLWDWKERFWLRMGWSRPLKVKGEKEKNLVRLRDTL